MFSLLKLQFFFLQEFNLDKRSFEEMIPYEADVFVSMWIVDKKKKIENKKMQRRTR